MRKIVLIFLVLVFLLMVGCLEQLAPSTVKEFEPTWESLGRYKGLIPKFTAEKFDADEWAELFEKSGAKFAGTVGNSGAWGYANDLTFKTPDRKPCSHAFVFKIERHHRPPIN